MERKAFRGRVALASKFSLDSFIWSAALLLWCLLSLPLSAAANVTYVQSNYAVPQSSPTSVTVAFNTAQNAGDLNIVVVGWNNTTANVTSVADSNGNAYTLVIGPTVVSSVISQSIYIADNIRGGTNTVTVAFSSPAFSPDIRVLEYAGADLVNPIDVTSAATGNGGTSNSGSATTSNPSDLIFGANIVTGMTSGPGTGFTKRVLTSPDGDIAEDRTVSSTGSYSATALVSGKWIMQMVAIRGSSGVTGVAPAITSAASTTFTAGTASTFTVSATGSPVPILSESGPLPNGISFHDNGNGTAALSGTPSTSGTFPITISASNGVGSPATQNFTLTVNPANQVPAITSVASVTFTTGTMGTFTVTTTGVPMPTLAETGALPSGVTFRDNGNGSATLSGTPSMIGTFPIILTASSGVGSPATQNFTLTVNQSSQPPAITSANSATFTAGTTGSFTVTTTGVPTPTLTETGSLPSGVTFRDNGNGTATLSGNPSATGTFPITITAANGVGTPETQSFTLSVAPASQPPSFTSPDTTTFTTGTMGDFSVVATGTPTPSLAESGALPLGISFHDNGDGTATVSGTASAGGTFAITITASNGIGSPATQSFSLTVNQAPSITSAASTTFVAGSAGSFAITATGFPAPSLTQSGSLPSGLTFAYNGNGTASLSGTPAAGTVGTYLIAISADNGIGSPATQNFTLTVNPANQGAPIAFVQMNYATPQGNNSSVRVTYTKAQTAGNLNIVIVGWNDSTSHVNSVADSAGNTYVLAVGPTVQSGKATQAIYYAQNIASFAANSNTVTVTFSAGALSPDIRIAEYSGIASTNALDVAAAAQGTTGTSNSGSATTTSANDLLVGANLVQQTTRRPGTGYTARVITSPDSDILEDSIVTTTGSYSATATLSGGAWIMQMVAFRGSSGGALGTSPAITSGGSATFTVGAAGNFTVTTTGVPTPTLAEAGALPSAVIFHDNGNGTATLSGTPSTTGTFTFSITANNGIGSPATQNFTLNVNPATEAPAITSTANATFTVGTAGSFAVTSTGAPTPTVSESGPLPSGVTFQDNGDGTATLAGIPGAAGTFPITITAANGVGSPAIQNFTLTVNSGDTQPPTTPTNLAATAVSGSQINLSWTASSDNVGVTGYLIERCAGVGCSNFARTVTVPGTTYSDTGLVPNTSYTYQVKATDAAGNFSPYSNTATTTTHQMIAGLVAAYSFDEGTGTTVTDLSGNGNDGTVTNTTWTNSGKFGNALVFDGTSSVVSIKDSTSLHLTTGLTLEAWVNPSVVSTSWRDIVYKGNDNYFLEATTSNGPPSGGGTFGSEDMNDFGINVLPTNTWTHLAFTYDGSTLRLYVNGVQVSSTAQTGNIATSTNPLQIGGDNIFGQYFSGLIDEVRVYNIPLNQTQIQSDMATPVSSLSSLPIVTLGGFSELDFGDEPTGTTSAPQSVTITNSGSSQLSIAGIAISGGNYADFAQVNNCGSTLDAGNSCTVNMTFTPQATGARVASLQITDNAPGSPQIINLSGTGTGFSVSPQSAVLTYTATQQFTAGSGNITWSVDGIVGGSSSVGIISATGLYTPPASVGTHIVTAATSGASANATVYVTNYPGTFTFHNDNSRTGQNSSETVLNLNNVNEAQFGKLFSYPLDGLAYASPLYVANVNIPGQGFHNVVYIATENDTVYAWDADGLSSNPLWKVNFLASGVTTVPCGDTGECGDIPNQIGITGTPVIDASTGTLYVVASTKEGSSYVQRLHALDIATGAEKFGGPVVIQATVSGSGDGSQAGQLSFDPLKENQRAALLLANGVVYIAWASHGDQPPWHGWVMGYDASTLQQTMAYCVSPNGYGGGIWMSNGGLATDSTGNIFFTTGNGDFSANSGGSDYGDSIVKVAPNGSVIDYFTPYDQSYMEAEDIDLASAGPVLLLDQPGAIPHLLIAAGKSGSIYVVNRDNMGQFNPTNNNQIVQTMQSILPNGNQEEGNYSAPVFFNGYVYFGAVNDNIKAFQLSGGQLSPAPSSQSSETYPNRGASFAICANGASNGILWAVQDNSPSNGVLTAYDANDLSHELYNSKQAGSRDTLGVATKFSIPLVANGKVFVVANGQIIAYGLLR